MSKEELGALIQQRGRVKAKLTRYQTYFTKKFNKETDNISQLQSRIPDLQKVLNEFDTIQDKIETIDDSEDRAKERETFEEEFYNLQSNMITFIDERERERLTIRSTPNLNLQQSTSSDQIVVPTHPSNVKLPTLELPTFSGSYLEWTTFADTFNSLIHSNPTYTEIEKFHYLRSSLTGDACKAIEGISISAANYKSAWETLTKRFNNKRLIIQEHVQSILNSPVLIKNSHSSMRRLLDDITVNIDSLKTLEQPVEYWDALIVQIITAKFDYITRKDWESNLNSEVPSYKSLIEFLSKKVTLLESLNACDIARKPQFNTKYQNSRTSNNTRPTTSFSSTVSTKPSCPLCKQSHNLYQCPEFLKLTISERINEVTRMKLCANCFRGNHTVERCRMGTCRKCNDKHNSLIHKENTITNVATLNNPVIMHSKDDGTHVLLTTVRVLVEDNSKRLVICRGFLDNGSQSNLITQELCDRLNLTTKPINWELTGIMGLRGTCTKIAKIHIQSLYDESSYFLTCLVVPTISQNLPTSAINPVLFSTPHNLVLSDKTFYKPDKIDLLLNAQTFWEILKPTKVQDPVNPSIYYQETKLGYIVTGNTHHKQINSSSCNLSLNALNKQLERFWEVDEGPTLENTNLLSLEDQQCETYYQKTISRNQNGRYKARLPFKNLVNKAEKVGDTKQIAIKQFLRMELKFKNNPELRNEYSTFINEYLDLNHMEEIPSSEFFKSERVYLPHHSVIRDSSSTTRLRVVFNPSLKSTSGVSINETIMSGPKLQEDLFNIIIRFRMHQFVFTADINKMFRQILISEEDRKYQSIVWRENPLEPLKSYQLTTLTYGFNCSPFIAIRTLHKLAEDEGHNFPLAADILKRDFYMDDVITGANTIDETNKIRDQLTALLSKGCFELRKFASNDQKILPIAKENQADAHLINFDKLGNTKTLGLHWNCQEDTLSYQTNFSEIQNKLSKSQLTKRKLLSEISKIYDPLNLIGPVVVVAKLIIQELWKLKIGWDEIIPEELITIWRRLTENIHVLNDIKIPRKVISKFPHKSLQLHGFADASQSAYGCAVYVRTQNLDGNIETQLFTAKSRVAPLRTLTIPRLELMACFLLAKLVSNITKILNVEFDDICYYTDSSIALTWIVSTPNSFNTFVANRVAQIQNLSPIENWRHVNSTENPADVISRGQFPNDLVNNNLWFQGPDFLKNEPISYPKLSNLESTEIPEKRNTTLNFMSTINSSDVSFITKYSSFTKLCRVVATCMRFIQNCKTKNRNKSPLNADEISNAANIVIKIIQKLKFPDELNSLESNKNVKAKSKLKTLNPFIDANGLIRVGGRLKKSDLEFNQKHPIVLPKHHLTELIIRDCHLKQLHAGPTATLSSVRQNFWPIDGRNETRKVTRRCITCVRTKPLNFEPIMGDLPTQRLIIARPFTNCAIDYAGPLIIKEGNTRSKRTSKAYVAVFVCLSTKAVHLELVSNLTAINFLNTLKRFISRRGIPSNIYSDNATNFVGANNELKKLFHSSEFQNTVVDHLSNTNIKWHFIPARSPHMAGIQEAAVKSMKTHFKRVVGKLFLTFEEVYTLLSCIEACLNSRPLSPLTSDPNELATLTPGHFLIGAPLTAIPEHDVTDLPTNRLTRWKHINQLQQNFWNRWRKEYLNELQQRHKWYKSRTHAIAVGSLVILKENSPPLTWRMGRVTELHPGDDGVVRVVTVRTTTGVTRRAIRTICELPV